MSDYVITSANVDEVFQAIKNQLLDEPALAVSVKNPRVGNWSMSRLWRAWMTTTAEFMAARGVTVDIKNSEGRIIESLPFDADCAHQLFTKAWLGTDEHGVRLSWSRTGRDGMRSADVGERLHAMRQHEAWSLEKGIDLPQPRDSEYRDLQRAENE